MPIMNELGVAPGQPIRIRKRAVDDWLHDYETFWSESIQSLKKYMEENS